MAYPHLSPFPLRPIPTKAHLHLRKGEAASASASASTGAWNLEGVGQGQARCGSVRQAPRATLPCEHVACLWASRCALACRVLLCRVECVVLAAY